MTTVLERELIHFSFPVIKSAPDSRGHLRVYGCVTNDAVDRDLERIDMAFSKAALQAWMDTGANLRLQHDSKRPIGKGVSLDFRPEGHYLTSIVVDRDAAEMTREGVLTAYSVGISHPDFRPDPTGKAVRVITGRRDGTTEVAEVSLVDRPSNAACGVTILRKVAEQVDEFIAKAAGKPGKRRKTLTVAEASREATLTKMVGRPVRTQREAIRLMVEADLASPDPERRAVAAEILANGLV